MNHKPKFCYCSVYYSLKMFSEIFSYFSIRFSCNIERSWTRSHCNIVPNCEAEKAQIKYGTYLSKWLAVMWYYLVLAERFTVSCFKTDSKPKPSTTQLAVCHPSARGFIRLQCILVDEGFLPFEQRECHSSHHRVLTLVRRGQTRLCWGDDVRTELRQLVSLDAELNHILEFHLIRTVHHVLIILA